jgi:hypothetical protein
MQRGRVTAIGRSSSSTMPPPLPPKSSHGPDSSLAARLGGPSVPSPLFDFAGNQHGTFISRSSSTPVPQVMDYSAAHSYHSQQTHEWSQRAYKGILNAPGGPGGIVTLNLGVYEPTVDPKGRPILVQVMMFFLFNLLVELMFIQQNFETLEVHSSILDVDLVHDIKQKLLEPLRIFCCAIPSFDINTMVLRETTKGKWKEVRVDMQRPLMYFGDRFLKPSKKKSDPTPIFNAGPPQMFGLVFQKDVRSLLLTYITTLWGSTSTMIRHAFPL